MNETAVFEPQVKIEERVRALTEITIDYIDTPAVTVIENRLRMSGIVVYVHPVIGKRNTVTELAGEGELPIPGDVYA